MRCPQVSLYCQGTGGTVGEHREGRLSAPCTESGNGLNGEGTLKIFIQSPNCSKSHPSWPWTPPGTIPSPKSHLSHPSGILKPCSKERRKISALNNLRHADDVLFSNPKRFSGRVWCEILQKSKTHPTELFLKGVKQFPRAKEIKNCNNR